MLYDNHGRLINYLRLAVTDRCNLRCHYCMPSCGLDFSQRSDLLTYEEMIRITRVLAKEGVSKIRITGGEPFVRKNLTDFLLELSRIPGIDQVHITTNATLLSDKINDLVKIGIRSVNISLDSLDRQRFFEITKRDCLLDVLGAIRQLIHYNFRIKLNMVIMSGINTDDILPMINFTKEHPVEVRFLEEMPFNGRTQVEVNSRHWSYVDILNYIKKHYPSLHPIPADKYSTAQCYKINNHLGTIGIIASYTRTFCGTCNRIRLTPKGMLKTCLYDEGVFNLRDFIRQGASDDEIRQVMVSSINSRHLDGHEAEQHRNKKNISESMATIGG